MLIQSKGRPKRLPSSVIFLTTKDDDEVGWMIVVIIFNFIFNSYVNPFFFQKQKSNVLLKSFLKSLMRKP